MKIIFNLQSVGLSNNGGSRTIIKCAETLRKMKHNAIISTSTNRYSWHEISVPIINSLPKCDIIVATGYGSVQSTLRHKAKTKFYYIRGFEQWVTSEKKLLKTYKSLRCIVNSEWLHSYLKEHNIPSTLIYPGLDFDDFYIEQENRENIIGGIFSRRHKTKRHNDVIKIGELLGYKVLLLNRDICSPSVKELRQFYNRIKVWVSSSELEGLHNCPQEAALCGCALVVTDHPRGGVSDYATKKTALIYAARNIKNAAKMVDKLMNSNSLRSLLQKNIQKTLRNKIGSREYNMRVLARLFQGHENA